MQPQLPDEYFRVFENMLVAIADQHGKNPNRQFSLDGFAAHIGSKYRPGGFMLVGRAVNGLGNPGWNPSEINEEFRRATALAEMRKNPFNTTFLRCYHAPFWQVGERVFNKLPPVIENGFWADHIVWSNLEKVTYAKSGNPPQWLRDTQFPFANELLKIEHDALLPDYMLVSAGEWWYANHFTVEALGVERHRVADSVEAAHWGKTKVVFTEHPQGKKGTREEFAHQVMDGFEWLEKH